MVVTLGVIAKGNVGGVEELEYKTPPGLAEIE